MLTHSIENRPSLQMQIETDSQQILHDIVHSPKLLKRCRRKWTIELTPTYSYSFLAECRGGDCHPAVTAARLRGRASRKEEREANNRTNTDLLLLLLGRMS